jgi:hypothetical protein
MCEFVYEFINDPIDTDCTADQLEFGVFGILKNEMIGVKVG